MEQIIYRGQGGLVGLVLPTQEALEFFTIAQIAEKDVPPTLPYRFVTTKEVMDNLPTIDAWEWDDTIEPDGFGGDSDEFDAELLAAYHNRDNQ